MAELVRFPSTTSALEAVHVFYLDEASDYLKFLWVLALVSSHRSLTSENQPDKICHGRCPLSCFRGGEHPFEKQFLYPQPLIKLFFEAPRIPRYSLVKIFFNQTINRNG